MKTANFNQKNNKYIPTWYFLSRHLGHLKPPRTFLTRHLFIDGHLLPSGFFDVKMCIFYIMTCFFYFMANLLSSWRFDVITNFLLISWCTFRTFDIMTYILTLWHIFDFMTRFFIYFLTFWCTFRRYNVLLMTFLYIMTYILVLLHTFCNHDVPVGVMTYFIDAVTYFWRHILFGTFHFTLIHWKI